MRIYEELGTRERIVLMMLSAGFATSLATDNEIETMLTVLQAMVATSYIAGTFYKSFAATILLVNVGRTLGVLFSDSLELGDLALTRWIWALVFWGVALTQASALRKELSRLTKQTDPDH
jgi:hypothetical protein